MLRKIIGFFKRFFRSRGFRAAVKFLSWYFLINLVLGSVHLLYSLTKLGFSFDEALDVLRFAFRELSLTPGGISLGVLIGLVWYIRRKIRKTDMLEEERAEKEEEEEKQAPAVSSEPAPLGSSAPAQEEEFFEPKYFNSGSH